MSDKTTKPVKAARRTLERTGMEIIEEEYKTPSGVIDLIGRHNGCLVFVDVECVWEGEEAFPPELEERRDQAMRENQAFNYLMQTDAVNVPFRFDTVDIHVISPTRAMVRHGMGRIGSSEELIDEPDMNAEELDEAA